MIKVLAASGLVVLFVVSACTRTETVFHSPTAYITTTFTSSVPETVTVTVTPTPIVSDQQLIDAASADSRVQPLLADGYSFNFYRNGVYRLYPEVPQASELIEVLSTGNPSDMVGFLSFMYLERKINPAQDVNRVQTDRYDVVVNMSLGKVVVFSGPYKPALPLYLTVKREPDAPKQVFATPDPGLDMGEPDTSSRGVKVIEQTPRRIVVSFYENVKGQEYRRFTWDVSDRDIENILSLAKTNPAVNALLDKGARFSTIETRFSGGSYHDPATGASIEGLYWEAIVRIDLGEICYRIKIDYSSGYAYPFVDAGSIVPTENSSRLISLY